MISLLQSKKQKQTCIWLFQFILSYRQLVKHLRNIYYVSAVWLSLNVSHRTGDLRNTHE